MGGDGGRGRRGSARGSARRACEREGRLYRAWVGGDPAGVEPGAGSREPQRRRWALRAMCPGSPGARGSPTLGLLLLLGLPWPVWGTGEFQGE